MKKTLLATLMLISAFLTGCGGGSDTTSSTTTFNLQAAYKSNFTTTGTQKFNISGTYGSYSVIGSGTETVGAVTYGVFEGQNALQHTTTLLGKFTANGQSFPIAGSGVEWVDTNYMPKGSTGDDYYVVDGTANIPTAAKINDTGIIYTAKRYQTSSKTQFLGTSTVSYVVESDTSDSALVTLISTDKNASGETIHVSTEQYKVTTSNTFTKIKQTTVDNTNSFKLSITFTYI